jgi:hypothetical protein
MMKIRKKRIGVGIGYGAVVLVFFAIIGLLFTVGVIGHIEIQRAYNKGEMTISGKLPSLDNILQWRLRDPNKPHPKAKKLPHTWRKIKDRKVAAWCYDQPVRFVLNKGLSNEQTFDFDCHEDRSLLQYYAGKIDVRTITMEPMDSRIVQYGRLEKK